jgi:hypothetical protein
MLTNEKIAAIHANAVAHGFWEPGSEPTFGEYCAFIHEEISEAFSSWRNGEPDEYVKDGKPEGVWVELADVVIRIGDLFGRYTVSIIENEYYETMYGDMVDLTRKIPSGKFAMAISSMHGLVSKAFACEDGKDAIRWLVNTLMFVYAFADHNGIDLDAIIDRKCAYNATRPYKHGKRM